MALVKGYIYKIVNDINNRVYIGSTGKTLDHRLSVHVHDAKTSRLKHMPMYNDMLQYGFENFHIHKIKSVYYKRKCELRKIERKKILKYKTLVKEGGYNSFLPTSLNEDNGHLEYGRQYHQLMKEEIHKRKNRKYICDICGGCFTSANRGRHYRTKKHIKVSSTI